MAIDGVFQGRLAITSCGNSNTQTAELCQTACGVLLFHARPAGKYLQIPHVGLQAGISSRVDHGPSSAKVATITCPPGRTALMTRST